MSVCRAISHGQTVLITQQHFDSKHSGSGYDDMEDDEDEEYEDDGLNATDLKTKVTRARRAERARARYGDKVISNDNLLLSDTIECPLISVVSRTLSEHRCSGKCVHETISCVSSLRRCRLSKLIRRRRTRSERLSRDGSDGQSRLGASTIR